MRFVGRYQPRPAFSVNGEGFDRALDNYRKPSGRVSIIIGARNYGRFLPEAIESALAQTVPCEVIYSDDCSTDDSVAVARRYPIAVLTSSLHKGPAAARQKACEISKGDFLVNLDGDDRLPPDYVEKMLRAHKPGAPFCYGAAQAFGGMDVLWTAPDWGEKSLWVRNFVNTAAMYTRTAFYAAGGWQDSIGTLWDWDLALRASRFGTPIRSDAELLYRIHDDSFSHNYREREDGKIVLLAPKVRRRLARLSVGSILSGRIPYLFEEWLDRLASSVRQMQVPAELVLLNNSNESRFEEAVHRAVSRYEHTFQAIRVVPHYTAKSFDDEASRQNYVAGMLAEACNRLKSEMGGDVHWIVEDDVMVPLECGQRLWEKLTAGLVPPEAVTGVYRNRHVWGRIVGGWWRNGHGPIEPKGPPNRHVRVDFCGMGCCMYWKDRVPEWTSHFAGAAAHDWAWGMEIKRRGGKIIMLPEVQCGHALDSTLILRC